MAVSLKLSVDDIERIRQSWKQYTSGDVVEQGTYMFESIFKARPDMKRIWKFTDEDNSAEQFKKKPRFRFHITRLFGRIGMVVDGLNYLDELELEMEDLGKRHGDNYGVTQQHFQPVADGLLYALEKALGNSFTAEVKGSWVKLYQWMVEVMKRQMPE